MFYWEENRTSGLKKKLNIVTPSVKLISKLIYTSIVDIQVILRIRNLISLYNDQSKYATANNILFYIIYVYIFFVCA